MKVLSIVTMNVIRYKCSNDILPSETSDVLGKMGDYEDDLRLSNNIKSVRNNINLPSPPSSTRSSFDVVREDSGEEMPENHFESHHNSYYISPPTDNEPINLPENDIEVEIMVNELIKLVEMKKEDETEWRDIEIDFNGETILPNGLKIVNGVAEMPFIRDENFPTRFTNQLEFLKTVVTKFLIRYKCATPFLHPVDSLFYKIPHYYLIIKKPMDLNTVRNRINFLWYHSANECLSDIRQIFKNCYTFNHPESFVFSSCKKLEEYFEDKLKSMPENEVEIKCPPKPNLDEYLEKMTVKRVGLDSNKTIEPVKTSPLKMTTRSEKGITLRKPCKDLPVAKWTPTTVKKRVVLNEAMRECMKIVNQFFSKKYEANAWPFYEPVDITLFPDYVDKIKRPMDLTTIKNKIEEGKYSTVTDFSADMRLMFSNCLRYNNPESVIVKQAKYLRDTFEFLYARLPDHLINEKLIIHKNSTSSSSSLSDDYESHKSKKFKSSHNKHEKSHSSHKSPSNHSGHSTSKIIDDNEYEKRVKRLEKKLKELRDEMKAKSLENGTSTVKKSHKNGYKKTINVKKPKKRGRKRKHLSDSESGDDGESSAKFNHESVDDLVRLKSDLENLHASDLKNVLQILQKTESSLICDEDLTVEIDFEALKPKTLTELRKYVDSCMLNVKSSSSNTPSTSKITIQTPGLNRITDSDFNCDNSHNLSRANSRASNIQLSEPSSSDSEMD